MCHCTSQHTNIRRAIIFPFPITYSFELSQRLHFLAQDCRGLQISPLGNRVLASFSADNKRSEESSAFFAYAASLCDFAVDTKKNGGEHPHSEEMCISQPPI